MSPVSNKSFVECVREHILSHYTTPGTKLPSLRELAATFDIGVETARMALSVMIKDGYLECKWGKGYYVANRTEHLPVPLNNHCIGVLLPRNLPFFQRVLEGLDKACEAAEVNLIIAKLSMSLDSQLSILEMFLKAGVNHVIITPDIVRSQIAKLVRSYRHSINFLLLEEPLEGISLDSVVIDQAHGTYSAVKRLWELGHRRIAYIGKRFPKFDLRNAERESGFRRGCEECGIDSPEARTLHCDFSALDDRLLQIFTGPEAATAAIVYCDVNAMNTIAFLEAHHIRVPEDVSIIGFDNSDEGENFRIPLSSIDPRPLEMGECAGNLMLERMRHPDGNPHKVKRIIEPLPILRASCRSLLEK